LFAEDGKNFWGGPSVVNPDGEFMTHGLYFDETLIKQTLDLNQLHHTRARLLYDCDAAAL